MREAVDFGTNRKIGMLETPKSARLPNALGIGYRERAIEYYSNALNIALESSNIIIILHPAFPVCLHCIHLQNGDDADLRFRVRGRFPS